jgi:large subunit ribosomal protein L25
MKTVALTAFPRTLARRGGAKKLRDAGRVPAIIYGRHAAPQNLEIKRKQIEDLLHHSVSENLLLDLAVEGDPRPRRLALLREIQHHPLSGTVLHADLHEVVETEKVTIHVPVETTGEAVGVKAGGVLEHVLFRLKVRGLPKDLPEQVVIDVSHLEIGKAVHIGEVKPPPGVEILGDKHISVVAVAAPLTEEEEAAAEAEAAAAGEVEMIKEKKEEGEEGAPAEKGEKGAKAPAAGAAKAPGEKGAAPAAAAAPAAGAKAPAAGAKTPAAKAPEKKK